MLRFRMAGLAAAVMLSIVLTGCGGQKADRTDNSAASAAETAEGADAAEEQELDSAQAEVAENETHASTDLFMEDGAVCTQYFSLTPPKEWEGHVSYHYFQDPEAGRYALDILESESMTATAGTGGAVFSIVLYSTYPEERGMENSSYLGMLRNEEGRFFYVFLEHFSGNQYTEGSEEAYRKVADSEDGLAANLGGRGGYTFEKGKDSDLPEDREE